VSAALAAAAPAVDRRHDDAVVAGARALVERGLVVGSVGNVSARTREGMRITPTRLPHRTTTADDLVTVDTFGAAHAGRWAPSREWPLHLAVYAARPDAGAVVHTHSPQATAWSVVAARLDGVTEDFGYYDVAPVRTAAAADPGSDALAAAAVDALGADGRACLVHAHGVVAIGPTVEDAVVIAEVVEHQATIAWLLRGRP
jgi:L-fuculose-phosphate aldolase